MKVVIVGGVAGGATAAARLRRLDENMQIILLEKGPHISYANCGLPYYIGGDITEEADLYVQTPETFAERYNIEVHVLHEVTGVNTEVQTLAVLAREEGNTAAITYDKLLLAPGAKPVRPLIEGSEDERVFTLRTVEDTLAIKAYIEQKPVRTCVIAGGGYIGVEMADNLARQGIQVTLVEKNKHILQNLDDEMAASIEAYLRSKGVGLHLGEEVAGIDAHAGLVVRLEGGSTLKTDMVLLSVGIRPDTAFLYESGLAMAPNGAIIVNEHMQTSDAHIYAVGDAVQVRHFVTGQPAGVPLAGPANRQGRIAADNMAGIASKYSGAQGSAIAKVFDMAVASTGITERLAKAQKIPCDKVYITAASHAGYYPGAANMNLKLVFETPGGRILGAQVVGFDGVDKRCDVVATAMRAGLHAPQLAELELCYAPPYSSAKDPVNMLGYVAENVLSGEVKQYFWEDLKALPQNGSVTLLDVRSTPERQAGKVPGTVHIPLEQLRARLGELDKAKPVYVHCQSGMRSYVACRILAGNGFEAYNFAGGYNMYQNLVK